MKKALSIALALMLVFALAACGGTASSTPASTAEGGENAGSSVTPAATSDLKVAMLLPGSINDQGWNAEAYLGLTLIEEQLGAEIAYSESVAASDYEEVFRGYAEMGYDLVIGHGFQFGDAACAVAPEFPDTFFAITSADINQEPNVCGLMNKNDQQGFLSGVVAALETKSGVVGCVGGQEIPSITAYVEGFKQGVAYINPDIEVLATYTGNFEDVNAVKETALAMIKEGADIITHDADQAGLGIFEAVNGSEDVWAIGAIDDQYEQAPGKVITSAMSKLSGGIALAAQYLADTGLEPITYYFGVNEGTVYLADFRDYPISEETLATIEDVQNKIASGEIEIDLQATA